MAAADVNVQESWTMEPELSEPTPRRIAPSGYPDLNKPNSLLFQGIGAGLMIAGIILLAFGASRGLSLWTFTGIAIAILGMVTAVLIVPSLNNRHIARVKHLAENGVPVMARVLSADNVGGDNSFGRMCKFQVTTPNGELTHRTTHADDRLLPRKIPGNVTALLDLQTGDVELYCALPFRAVPRPVNTSATSQTSRPIPSSLPGSVIASAVVEALPPPTGEMGTINMGSIQRRPGAQTAEAPPVQPQPENRSTSAKPASPKDETPNGEQPERPSSPASLPWE
jgi:hypothetical protein